MNPHSVRVPVSSTLLAFVGYATDQTLELQFRSGARYRYFAVPPAVVAGLITADSKGAYFNRHLRDHFRYQRLA